VADVSSNLGAFVQYGKGAAGNELEALDALGSFMGLLELGGSTVIGRRK